MIKAIVERVRQGRRTVAYPGQAPELPERFRGVPQLALPRCPERCEEAVRACPTGALAVRPVGGEGPREGARVQIDLGLCVFCGACERACGHGAIQFTRDYRLAARTRRALCVTGGTLPRVEPLIGSVRRVLGRALTLRHVSAGGCNACEADTNVLTTIVFDLSRFGIHIAASPRHADGMIVSGPVTRNMEAALRATYDAIPAPKIVIAVGACAISGGIYRGHREACDGVDGIVPVDLYVPGCPPHPLTILDGVLRLIGRRVPE